MVQCLKFVELCVPPIVSSRKSDPVTCKWCCTHPSVLLLRNYILLAVLADLSWQTSIFSFSVGYGVANPFNSCSFLEFQLLESESITSETECHGTM